MIIDAQTWHYWVSRPTISRCPRLSLPSVEFHNRTTNEFITISTATVHLHLIPFCPSCFCFLLHLACGAGGKVAFWADTTYTRRHWSCPAFSSLSHGNSNFYSEAQSGRVFRLRLHPCHRNLRIDDIGGRRKKIE
jgi:hypothetical protein